MSIAAMNWALQQRLESHQQQILLYVIADSADPTGMTRHCDPDYMADRSRLSRATMFRRLSELETAGVLRRAKFYSERGEALYEIRLQLSVLIDVPIKRRRGLSEDEVDEDSSATERPKSQAETLVAGDQSLTGAEPESHCCDSICPTLSKDSPLPPSGGESGASHVEESEPEHFGAAWSAYPGHEAMRRDLALIEFRLLPVDKQKLCRAAVPVYAEKLRQIGRTKPMNFHIWVRTRGFDEFPNAVLAEDRPLPPERRFVQGDELDGLAVATRIAERREPPIVEDRERGKGVWTRKPIELDLAALASFAAADPGQWEIADEGTPQFAAWRDRLQIWLGHEVRSERIWLEPYNAAVHGLSATHPDFKLRKSKNGFRVPAPWPPRRDGSWPSGEAT